MPKGDKADASFSRPSLLAFLFSLMSYTYDDENVEHDHRDLNALLLAAVAHLICFLLIMITI